MILVPCPPWKAQLTSKIFTPLQAHGMEKFSAWRGRKFSLATQKNTAALDKQARSNKILQNKQNKSVFILFLQNKAISLQCYSGQQNNNH